MEKKIEIAYRLTDRELLDLTVKLCLDYLKKIKLIVFIPIGILLLNSASIQDVGLLIIMASTLFMATVFLITLLGVFFYLLKKAGIQTETRMILCCGVLEINGYNNTTLPCSYFESAAEGKRLIFLKRKASAQLNYFTVVPVRAFGSEGEKECFLEAFQFSSSQQYQNTAKMENGVQMTDKAAAEERMPTEGTAKWKYHFDYEIGINDILDISQGIIQKTKKYRIPLRYLWFIVCAWSLASLQSYWLGIGPFLSLGLIPVFWFLALKVRDILRGTAGLEKQYKKGNLHPELAGHWSTQVGEDGITLFHSGTHTLIKWDAYPELLETDGLFCFYKDTYNEPVLISKAAFDSAEEEKAFIQYCSEKGMQWSILEPQLQPVLTPKRVRIAFILFLFYLAFLYHLK